MGLDLDPDFISNSEPLPSGPDYAFVEQFEEGLAALIVDRCRVQPGQTWTSAVIGQAVLQTLDRLGPLSIDQIPVPVAHLVVSAHILARQIVPRRRQGW